MGNCITRKKSQEPSPILTQGLPRVNLWVESSDFSSIPDLDQFGERTEEPTIYRPATSSLAVEIVPDGYSTAPEDQSEEEDPQIAGPCAEPEKDKESRLSSEYLTGDETEVANEETTEEDPSLQAMKRTLELEAVESNDDTPQMARGDDRQISALATPLKLNEISPRIVEGLADKKGRVKKRTIQRYLQLRRDAQPVG